MNSKKTVAFFSFRKAKLNVLITENFEILISKTEKMKIGYNPPLRSTGSSLNPASCVCTVTMVDAVNLKMIWRGLCPQPPHRLVRKADT